MSDTILIDHGTITVLPEQVRAMTVHAASECAGRTCVVHTPTKHAMRELPLHWRADRGIFERTCEHGIGHPDPDQQTYWREQAEAEWDRHDIVSRGKLGMNRESFVGGHISAQMVHGCDLCCRGAAS